MSDSVVPTTYRRARTALIGVIALMSPTLSVFGQGSSEPASAPPKVIKILPAAEPVPALNYRLFPEQSELIPGNAAIFYHRAIEFYLQKRSLVQSKDGDHQTKIQEWGEQPIGDLPREEVRQMLEVYRSVLKEVELGTRREFCNWEFDRRDEGFELLLPDIQETRSLARLVALQARLEIAEGRIDRGLHWIKTGLVFSRHVAQGTSLIQALIGMANGRHMTEALEELIQAPGAPSLFWALAMLPRPLIALGPAIEGERYMLEREIPGLRELDSDPWSLEKAQAFSDVLQRKLWMFGSLWASAAKRSDQSGMEEWSKRLLMSAMVARAYPEAKRQLVAGGRPAARIEAMPAIQAVSLNSMKLYEKLRDDLCKWAMVPYPLAYEGIKKASDRIMESVKDAKQGPPFGDMLFSLQPVLVASVRSERQLAAMQAIEAIRLYVGSHDGQWPPSLEAIKEVPVFPDPATGKPFEYKVDGTSAKLSAPLIPGEGPVKGNALNYDLRLVK